METNIENKKENAEVDAVKIMEILRGMQAKMASQEALTLMLKEQYDYLKEQNEQLQKENDDRKLQFDRYRTDMTLLKTQQHNSGNFVPNHHNVSINENIAEQQEVRRLQAQINYLEEERARLQAKVSKSRATVCCCFHFCHLLFRRRRKTDDADLMDDSLDTSSYTDLRSR